MMLKIIHAAGLAACILLIVSCFMPWAYFADPHIPNEAARTFTGFYSYGNNYGKPGKFLVTSAVVVFVLMLLPKIWAKRVNLFVAALTLGYAVKSYSLFVSCYYSYCPEKKPGIFLMLAACVVMMIAAALPRLELSKTTRQQAFVKEGDPREPA